VIVIIDLLFRIKEGGTVGSHDDPTSNSANPATNGSGKYVHLKDIEIASVSFAVCL